MKRGGRLQRRTPLRNGPFSRLKSGRCCGKKAFATEDAAQAALFRIQMISSGEKVPQRAYQCRDGWWHLTSQRRVVSTDVPQATRDLVLERDDYSCFCCGKPLLGEQYSLQHRDARGMGGSSDPLIHSPANLILLAGSALTECHGRVERRGEADNVAGYWLKTGQDPAKTLVLHWRYGPVLLGHDGSITPVGRAA